MTVLLLRIEGPMQSWGITSRFTERDTGTEPSKSGVVGMICSALGRNRESDISDLAQLRMGVRVDREGRMMRDFHTIKDVARAGRGGTQDTAVSNRYYLSDARFLVGLEGDLSLLEQIKTALENPKWTLFLGRKSFVPSMPVAVPDGLVDESLEEVLRSHPWFGREREEIPERLRMVVECGPQEGTAVADQPVDMELRKFGLRNVKIVWYDTPSMTRGDS